MNSLARSSTTKQGAAQVDAKQLCKLYCDAQVDAKRICKLFCDEYEPETRIDTFLGKLSKFHLCYNMLPYQFLVDLVISDVLGNPIKEYVLNERDKISHWGDLMYFIIKGHTVLRNAGLVVWPSWLESNSIPSNT